MIVVLVLIISCQVLENPRNGPLIAQRINSRRAIIKIHGRPIAAETAEVNRVNMSCFFFIDHILSDPANYNCKKSNSSKPLYFCQVQTGNRWFWFTFSAKFV